MKVAICICTWRRPQGLTNLLEHLQRIETNADVMIAVADNDGAHEGLAVCQALPDSYRWKVVSTAVENQGISYSRNAAADLALAEKPDLVAFLDDDEWPEPEWLQELMRIQQDYHADAVGGPTISVFPENTPDETRNNQYFGADLNLPDGSRCQLEAAGNFLIKADTLQRLAPQYFHPDFALSGGEDLAFFMSLKELGATMHWAANARVNESVSSDRLTMGWMKKRVIVIANSRVRVMRMLQPGWSATLERCAKTCALFSLAAALSVAGLFNQKLAQRARILRWKFWGKFTAHLQLSATRAEGR